MMEVGVRSSWEASDRNCFCLENDSSSRLSMVLKLAASGFNSAATPLSSSLWLRFSSVIWPTFTVKVLRDFRAQLVMRKTPMPQIMKTAGKARSTIFLNEPMSS